MRYLLHESQLGELNARQAYLYDIFHLYFIPGKPDDSFVPLIPMGCVGASVLFITGHTNLVWMYLEKHLRSIPEDTIVITSCCGRSFREFAGKKKFYVPDTKQPLCKLHPGQPYGFGFDISDAELDLNNSSGDIMTRIESAYQKL